MRILVTAFKPYDCWGENSSWLALQHWLRDYDGTEELVTRLYPVDLDELHSRLPQDLQWRPDAILHLGQAPGMSHVAVEAIALNAAGLIQESGRALRPIVTGGPVAYQTRCDVERMAVGIRGKGVPAAVSYHAGTYLCNALFYLSHHLMASSDPQIGIAFLHLPLATEQVVSGKQPHLPSLPTGMLAGAIGAAVEVMADRWSAGVRRRAIG